MKYKTVREARFIDRPNRFVAHCELDGQTVTCHVKNTGRCRELLVPGATVWLAAGENPARKTAWDLVAVRKGELLINMDSAAPNAVFREYAQAGKFLPGAAVRPEFPFGNSRLDFCLTLGESRTLVEVKGCTLEEDGVCRFPDAPTDRGRKHLLELAQAARAGENCAVVFVIQMERAKYFTPNDRTDPRFAAALREARDAGVRVLAYTCRVTPDSLEIQNPLEVRL